MTPRTAPKQSFFGALPTSVADPEDHRPSAPRFAGDRVRRHAGGVAASVTQHRRRPFGFPASARHGLDRPANGGRRNFSWEMSKVRDYALRSINTNLVHGSDKEACRAGGRRISGRHNLRKMTGDHQATGRQYRLDLYRYLLGGARQSLIGPKGS